MITLKWYGNSDRVIALYAELGDKLRPELARALNAGSKGLKSAVKKEILAKSFSQLTKGDVDDSNWSFQKATEDELTTVERISGKRFGIERFIPDLEAAYKNRSKSGLSVNLPFVGSKTMRSGFAAKLDRGKKKIRAYTRDPRSEPLRRRLAKNQPKRDFYKKKAKEGEKEKTVWLKHRFPIASMTFMAIPQLAEDKEVVTAGEEKAAINFFKQADHLLHRLMEQYG